VVNRGFPIVSLDLRSRDGAIKWAARYTVASLKCRPTGIGQNSFIRAAIYSGILEAGF
jgi:hypothetical protein